MSNQIQVSNAQSITTAVTDETTVHFNPFTLKTGANLNYDVVVKRIKMDAAFGTTTEISIPKIGMLMDVIPEMILTSAIGDVACVASLYPILTACKLHRIKYDGVTLQEIRQDTIAHHNALLEDNEADFYLDLMNGEVDVANTIDLYNGVSLYLPISTWFFHQDLSFSINTLKLNNNMTYEVQLADTIDKGVLASGTSASTSLNSFYVNFVYAVPFMADVDEINDRYSRPFQFPITSFIELIPPSGTVYTTGAVLAQIPLKGLNGDIKFIDFSDRLSSEITANLIDNYYPMTSFRINDGADNIVEPRNLKIQKYLMSKFESTKRDPKFHENHPYRIYFQRLNESVSTIDSGSVNFTGFTNPFIEFTFPSITNPHLYKAIGAKKQYIHYDGLGSLKVSDV